MQRKPRLNKRFEFEEPTKKTIKIVERNYKKSPGLYVYIKIGKYPAREWKLDFNARMDAYIQLYLDMFKKTRKRKGTKKDYEVAYSRRLNTTTTNLENMPRNFKMRLKKLSKSLVRQSKSYIKTYTRIDEALLPGETYIDIPDIDSIDDNSLKQSYKRLFRPLVWDDRLLELLVSDINIENLKNNFETRFFFHSEKAERITSAKIRDNPLKIIRTLQENPKFRKGVLFESETYNYLKSRMSWVTPPVDNFVLNRIRLVIYFRKSGHFTETYPIENLQ